MQPVLGRTVKQYVASGVRERPVTTREMQRASERRVEHMADVLDLRRLF